MQKELKETLEIIASLQKIDFEIEGDPYVMLYNETQIGEGEAIKCIKEQDYDNYNVIVIRKEQYQNVFMNMEIRE